MKVTIGKYINWIGPYQIAEFLCFWEKRSKYPTDSSSSDFSYRLGGWLSTDRHGKDSWLMKLCTWIHNKRKRKISVKIDKWDYWSADMTLAHIALPLLKELLEKKQGSPHVDDEDVPAELRAKIPGEWQDKEPKYDIDTRWHDRWRWVLGEIIWAFEAHLDEHSTDQFYDHSEVDEKAPLKDQVEKIKVDYDGLQKFVDRKQNGFRLFGKYYQCLWS